MTEQSKKPSAPTPAVKEMANITEQVLARVNQHKEAGLRLPHDYSVENALKSAYLILQEGKDKSGKPVLESCTKVSIANSLFEMVVRALSPIKKQCYFIPYGEKLTLLPSYFGNIATARRVGLKNIVANVIYEGDVKTFAYSTDTKTGRHSIEKHEQKLENIDINKIAGAYAVYEMEDGSMDVEIMTIKQIKTAWLQGATKGNSGAHQNFSEEMSKRTVINRACKKIINSSDDSYLFEGDDEHPVSEKPGANEEEIALTEAEVVETTLGNQADSAPPPAPETDQEPKQGELTVQGQQGGPGF